MGVAMMANKNIICDPCRPCQSMLCILNSIISLNLTDSLHSQLPQVPRCPDLAIFVSTTTITMTAIMMMTETDCFTPCACTWCNNRLFCFQANVDNLVCSGHTFMICCMQCMEYQHNCACSFFCMVG